MSIRIGLYDFFAFTVPGVFYLLIVGYTLALFQVPTGNYGALNDLSISSFIVLVGAGYITGQLVDPIAYGWMRLFYGPNTRQRVWAFHHFQQVHPRLVPNFEVTDWEILLQMLKAKHPDVASEVEMHNVASIMLRNISLGFTILAIVFLAYYLVVAPNVWNLVLATVCLVLSYIGLRQSRMKREWFYAGIFNAVAASQLGEATWIANAGAAENTSTGNASVAFDTNQEDQKPNAL